MSRPARKKTAFVPRSLFATALASVSVVPMCVVACGGTTVTVGADSGTAPDGPFGVAADAFRPDNQWTVAAVAFDAFSVADIGFDTVADVGFDGGDAADVMFTVAADAFGVADVGFGG